MSVAGTPIVLMILDGWGLNAREEGNAIAQAHTPNMDRLQQEFPFVSLGASGADVGLPPGQMGNSEVGHLNLGAGRIVYQELTRITRAVEDGSLFNNPVLHQAMRTVQANGSSLHFMGLVSDGGVHSHLDHLYALLDMAQSQGISRVYVHAFLDGRDVPPDNAAQYLEALEERMRGLNLGGIATVMGRYYAMDRDKRWDRTEKAFLALTEGEGWQASSPLEAVEESYRRGETDEFVQPTVIRHSNGPTAVVQDGDAVVFFNFRPDRARQITRAFVDEEFSGFDRNAHRPRVHYVCLTQYDETIPAPVAFPPQELTRTLGELLGERGLDQLRIAETEKYAHVTYFFSGGEETSFPGENRCMIPSPQVATYDLQPQMSAPEVTEAMLEELEGDYSLVVLNYANGDMVGHTGFMDAAIQAIETVDECMGRVVKKVQARGGTVLVTSDHGNAEQMVDYQTGNRHTAHTSNPVPLVLVGKAAEKYGLREGGRLADIAPTILQLLGMEPTPQMTGTSLLEDR